MRLMTNEELLMVSGGADSKEAEAEAAKKKVQMINKGCTDLAEKAWGLCKEYGFCRLATNEKTVKETVTKECTNSMNKN